MTEVELIEKAAIKVGMKSLMNHGAASCVYSEGCEGVTQEHLIAFAREVALHCVAALAGQQSERPAGQAVLRTVQRFLADKGHYMPDETALQLIALASQAERPAVKEGGNV